MTLTYRAANGTQWPLDGSLGVQAIEDSQGLYTAPVDLTLDPRVGADGSALVTRRQPPRPIDLRLLVVSDATGEVLTIWRNLYRAFAAGAGTLVHQTGSVIRELRAVNLESVVKQFAWSLDSQPDEVMTLSLLALDPWWYGAPQILDLIVSGDSVSWSPDLPWNAAYPWNGGASLNIVVDGDAPAYPVIDIFGAATEFTVTLSSGTGWTMQRDIVAGERVTVDHRPGRLGPKMANTAFVDWSLLTERSRLFALPTGAQSVLVNVIGDNASTAAVLTWEPRYLTP